MKIQRLKEDSDSFQQNLRSAQKKIKEKHLGNIKHYFDERTHLIRLMKKYANGQAVATRLGRQLKTVVRKLQMEIKAYNSMVMNPDDKLELENIRDGTSVTWNNYNQLSNDINASSSIRHQCIELMSTKLRCDEEEILVKEEMASFIAWLLNEYNQLTTILEKDSFLSGGQKSVLIKEALLIEKDIEILNRLFKPYIGDSEVPCVFHQYVLYSGDHVKILTEELTESEEITLEQMPDVQSDSEYFDDSESDCENGSCN